MLNAQVIPRGISQICARFENLNAVKTARRIGRIVAGVVVDDNNLLSAGDGLRDQILQRLRESLGAAVAYDDNRYCG